MIYLSQIEAQTTTLAAQRKLMLEPTCFDFQEETQSALLSSPAKPVNAVIHASAILA